MTHLQLFHILHRSWRFCRNDISDGFELLKELEQAKSEAKDVSWLAAIEAAVTDVTSVIELRGGKVNETRAK